MFWKLFSCFLLVKFNIDVVVIVLHELKIGKGSVANFGFVRTMLGAIFHLFVLSLQTPMYETDENKNNGNLRMQNVTGNETLAAPMYEENPTSLFPHVHIVNNPKAISSNITDSQGNDPNVFHSSGNAPLNSIVSTHGKAHSTSSIFGITLMMEMFQIILITETLRLVIERLHYSQLKIFVFLQKFQKSEKKVKTRKQKKQLALLKNLFSRLLASFEFIPEHSFFLTPLTYLNMKDSFPTI